MEIYEYIYEGVVDPYYNKTTRAYSNRSVHNSNIRDRAALSNTNLNMDHTENHKKNMYNSRVESFSQPV